MKFDRTINLGTVLNLVGLVATLFVLYTGVVVRLAALEARVDAMWRWFATRIEQINHGRNCAP